MAEVDCIYYGLFLKEPLPGKLENVIQNQHVTFGYKIPYPLEYVGKEFEIELIGYGNNEKNEAYEVKLPRELWDIYHGSVKRHVTVSTSRFGRPVDSSLLSFRKRSDKIGKRIPCVFGYFSQSGTVITEYYPAKNIANAVFVIYKIGKDLLN